MPQTTFSFEDNDEEEEAAKGRNEEAFQHELLLVPREDAAMKFLENLIAKMTPTTVAFMGSPKTQEVFAILASPAIWALVAYVLTQTARTTKTLQEPLAFTEENRKEWEAMRSYFAELSQLADGVLDMLPPSVLPQVDEEDGGEERQPA